MPRRSRRSEPRWARRLTDEQLRLLCLATNGNLPPPGASRPVLVSHARPLRRRAARQSVVAVCDPTTFDREMEAQMDECPPGTVRTNREGICPEGTDLLPGTACCTKKQVRDVLRDTLQTRDVNKADPVVDAVRKDTHPKDLGFIRRVLEILRPLAEERFAELADAARTIFGASSLKVPEAYEDAPPAARSRFREFFSNAVGAVKEAGKAVLQGVWWVLKKLVEEGVKFVKFVMTNPATASVMLMVAKQIKVALCREVALRLVGEQIVHKDRKGFKDFVNDVSRGAEILKPVLMRAVRDKLPDLMKSVTPLVTTGMTMMLGPLGLVGGSGLNAVANMFGGLFMSAAQEAAELAIYRASVSSSFASLIEILDIRDCFRRVERIVYR